MSEPNQNLEEFLFEAALAKASAIERATFLDGVCRGNPALRARLDILLEGHFQAAGFLAASSKRIEEKPALPATEDESASTFIGGYKLLEKIGEGGFGDVWLAEQKEPVKRRVALKIIKLGMDTKQVVARFEAERQALAMMDHPNIAKVFDGGATATGRPYFIMELVRGVRITEYCDQHQLLTPERLKLFVEVCRAIQHAHQKGIIHRDIKPSNILVTLHDGVPVPKVIDFGIAKATQQELTDRTVFTQFRQFMGTPAYVSPEQAEMGGLDVDTRSDIYSLGVLLYELLTGKTPFEQTALLTAGLDEIRRTIRELEPLRPSTRLSSMTRPELTTTAQRRGAEAPKLISLVRGDLDWIVMKCLEKDRARRYEAAIGLARDIERHLKSEPVVARPPSRLYEFQKTVRRHWVGFAAGAAVLAVLAAGAVVSSWEAVRARSAERGLQRLLYGTTMNVAQAAWEQNNLDRLRQLLGRTATYPDRGFEWYYWQRQNHLDHVTLRGHLSRVLAVAFSPDSRWVATASRDGTVKLWEVATGREVFALNGAPVSRPEPILIPAPTKGVSSMHPKAIFSVAFSPDGRMLAAGSVDSTVKVWEVPSGRELLVLKGHRAPVRSVAFSPDGLRIVSGSNDRTARVWDSTTGAELLSLQGHGDAVFSVAFSPEGRRIVTGSTDNTARIWDAAGGHDPITLTGHTAWVCAAAFSPDGQRVLTGSNDDTAKLWDAATGRELQAFRGHSDSVLSVAFSPDGRWVLTGSADQTARLWDAAAGHELAVLKGHTAAVTSVACSPDGRWLVTGSIDETAKVWEAAIEPGVILLNGGREALGLSFSPDGRRIVVASDDKIARVYDVSTGRELCSLVGHRNAVRSAAFSPDGQRIVTGSGDQTARVWDSVTGRQLVSLDGHTGPVVSVAFSPDGRRIVTGSADRLAKVWDAALAKPLLTLTGHSEAVLSVAFSPDGLRVATASADQTARIWDTIDGKPLLRLVGHSNWILSVAFSPDGRQIATACDDQTVRLWDGKSGRKIRTFEGHRDNVKSVAFSPDGRRILTGSSDKTTTLWDTSNAKELLSLQPQVPEAPYVLSVAFSPDGRHVAAGGGDWPGPVRVWQAATPEQVATWEREETDAVAGRDSLRREQLAAAEREGKLEAEDPGRIKQWLVVLPIPFEEQNGAQALAQQQIPDEANLRPLEGQPSQAGESGRRWRAVQLDDYRIDFNFLLKANPSWAVAYAVSYIESETNQPGLLMKVGSDDESKVYLNGRRVYRCDEARPYIVDQDTVKVDLKAGLNVLVFKVVNEVDYWQGSVRFTDAAGQPVKGIRTTLAPR